MSKSQFFIRRGVGLSILCAGLITIVALLSIIIDRPVFAAQATFTVVGTHANATAQPTLRGKTIADMAIVGTQLYAGYGDYDTNTGPVRIRPFDLTTNTFGAVQLVVDTEEISTFRTINGSLYAPMIDPRAAAWTANVGYASNQTGTWVSYAQAPAIHVFDIASLNGTDRWMVGSAVQPDGVTLYGATAYRSLDGNTGWTRVQTDQTVPYEQNTGFERYYWVAELNGKIYMQAQGVTPATPVRSFDGATWQAGTTDSVCKATMSHLVESFGAYIVCGGAYGPGGEAIQLFDGSNVSYVQSNVGFVYDFYKADDGYLYALGLSGVSRTSNGVDWVLLTQTPSTARSLAVRQDTLFLGTTNAQIMKLDIPLSQVEFSHPVITSIAPSSTAVNTSAQVTIQGSGFMQGASVYFGDTISTYVQVSGDGNSIVAQSPMVSGPGVVDVRVVNPDTGAATLAGGFTNFIPGRPVVQDVEFVTDQQGRHVLSATGQDFIVPTDSSWFNGLSNHLVTLNGEELGFCVEDSGITVEQLQQFAVAPEYYSTSAPCYYLMNLDVETFEADMYLTATSLRILLPDDFDTASKGSLRIRSVSAGEALDSSVYTFNNTSIPGDVPSTGDAPGVPNTGILSQPAIVTLVAAAAATLLGIGLAMYLVVRRLNR